MLSKEFVLEAVRNGRTSDCLDGRDYARLVEFFSPEDWAVFGFKLKAGVEPDPMREWDREIILAQMKEDVNFGFKKALSKRGISAGLMHKVVKLWLWVLEDDLLDRADDLYAQYGLPLFAAVARKYGFPCPIGSDVGDELKYSMEG